MLLQDVQEFFRAGHNTAGIAVKETKDNVAFGAKHSILIVNALMHGELGKRKAVYARGNSRRITYIQGMTELHAERNHREYKTVREPIDTEIPIIVLVDGGSASSSEIVTGALQDRDRATVMGRRTYGKGLVQTIRPLPYNGQLKVTISKYYTPSGRCVQAIDYARRGEDGSVSHIPDSLTHEFKTLHGRTVRDGGGITPDVELPAYNYSRLAYALVVGGIIDHYALDYVGRHASIPAVEDFHFNEYEDFVEFAKKQEFDYRSSAMAYFDQMKKELEKDGMAEGAKEQLEALKTVIDRDKEQFLRDSKEELIPFIEEEIAVRYWFQEAGIQVRLRYDDQLKAALEKPMIKF